MSSLRILEGLTIDEIASIVYEFCGGDEKKLEAFLKNLKKKNVKFAKWSLVDEEGRIIPPEGLDAMSCIPNRDFYLKQPKMESLDDFEERIICFQNIFVQLRLSPAEFYKRTNEIIDEIRKNRRIANLLYGVYLPIVLPQVPPKFNYGQALENIFLPAMENSFKKYFPNREFKNWLRNSFKYKINIVQGSRHEKLFKKMRQKKFVVGIFFPTPLQGFSIKASRQVISYLPESLLLGGGIDTFTAMTLYPDVLARNFNVPGYDLAAISYEPLFHLSVTLQCHYGGGNLEINTKEKPEDANANFSSSLLFLPEE